METAEHFFLSDYLQNLDFISYVLLLKNQAKEEMAFFALNFLKLNCLKGQLPIIRFSFLQSRCECSEVVMFNDHLLKSYHQEA